jgi:hypothetical protein
LENLRDSGVPSIRWNKLARSIAGELEPVKRTLDMTVYDTTETQLTAPMWATILHDDGMTTAIPPENQRFSQPPHSQWPARGDFLRVKNCIPTVGNQHRPKPLTFAWEFSLSRDKPGVI